MAQVKKNKKLTASRFSLLKKEISSFFYVVLTLLFLLSIYSHDPSDPSFLNSGLASSVNNYIGIFGAYISFICFMLFGNIALVLPFLAIFVVIKNMRNTIDHKTSDKFMNTGLLTIIVLSSCVIMDFIGRDNEYDRGIDFLLGGQIGSILFDRFSTYIGVSGTVVVSFLLLFYSSMAYLHISIKKLFSRVLLFTKYLYLKTKFILNSILDKYKLYIAKRKDSAKVDKLSKEVKATKAAIEIPEKSKHSSKRAFKEKQT